VTPRIQRLLKSLDAVRDCRFEVSIAKGLLVTRAFSESEGEPQIIRCARAFATVLDEIPIYIEPDDLLLGNLASKPGAVELTSLWSTWTDAEIDALCAIMHVEQTVMLGHGAVENIERFPLMQRVGIQQRA